MVWDVASLGQFCGAALLNRRLTIPTPRRVRRVEWMHGRSKGASLRRLAGGARRAGGACQIEDAEPLTDKQHLVRPRGKRFVAGIAAVVVVMNVRDVEELLQSLHDIHKLRFVVFVELDLELID